jgi:hypothetical protein
MRAQLILFASVLLGASAALPSRADACSCTTNGPLGVVLPKDGDRVPANVRLWVAGFAPELVELLAPDGTRIALERSAIELEVSMPNLDNALNVLTPREPLPPGEGYVVKVQGRLWPDVTFEVEDETDRTAPPVPEVLDIEPEVNDDPGNSCGQYRGVSVKLDAEGLVFVARGDERSPPQADPPQGNALEVQESYDGTAWLAYGGGCAPAWPGDEIAKLRFASFDVAGNFSGLSDEVSIDRPEHHTSSLCTIAAVSPARRSALGAGWLFAALVLLARRSRR